jgi:hypothetical protein
MCRSDIRRADFLEDPFLIRYLSRRFFFLDCHHGLGAASHDRGGKAMIVDVNEAKLASIRNPVLQSYAEQYALSGLHAADPQNGHGI